MRSSFVAALASCLVAAACSSSSATPSLADCCVVALPNARDGACFCGTLSVSPGVSNTVSASGSSCSVNRTMVVDGGVVTTATTEGRLPLSVAECPAAEGNTAPLSEGGADGE
jgi:hypothetical protein